jgi:hypothetical protein
VDVVGIIQIALVAVNAVIISWYFFKKQAEDLELKVRRGVDKRRPRIR